jgi:hypothetical protein
VLCVAVLGVLGGGMTNIGVAGAQLPTVDVPSLGPVPTVQAPSISVPKLPAAPVLEPPPLPTAPSIPSISTLQGDTASATTDVAKDTVAALRRAVGTAPSSSTTSGSASAATGSGAAPAGSPSGSGTSRTRRALEDDGAGHTAKHRSQRRVRRNVRRFAGCLGRLPSRQRKVLTLRAGIGSQSPSTRRRVARRLDLSAARVAGIERRGLRALRALGRGGGCGAASDAALVGPAAPGAAAAGLDARSEAGTGTDAGTHTRTSTVSDGESGSSRSGEAIALVPRAQEQASDWSLAVVLAGLLLLGFALWREFGPAGPSTRRARR